MRAPMPPMVPPTAPPIVAAVEILLFPVGDGAGGVVMDGAEGVVDEAVGVVDEVKRVVDDAVLDSEFGVVTAGVGVGVELSLGTLISVNEAIETGVLLKAAT